MNLGFLDIMVNRSCERMNMILVLFALTAYTALASIPLQWNLMSIILNLPSNLIRLLGDQSV